MQGMRQPLQGKRAVVTGGTRGIGRAIVEGLLAEGAAVTLCGRTPESTAAAVEELGHPQVYGKAADVGRQPDVEALFDFALERMGGIDILVANAGVGIFGATGDLSAEQWDETIGTNLTGVFLTSRAAIQRMRVAGGGFLVLLSSLAGRNAFAGGAAYNASKFAVTGMAEAIMLDHRHDGIRVTTIMPGSVDTGFSPRSAGTGAEWKIAAADVAEMVIAVLSMPERTLVSRVEMRPSRPPQ